MAKPIMGLNRFRRWVSQELNPSYQRGLSPGREAQAGSGSGRRSVTRHIFEPVEVEMLDRACDRHPVQDLRRSGMQLVARQRLEELCVLIGAGLEDRAVEILVDQEVAQA